MVGEEEKVRPPIFSVKTESLVGLEEKVQVSEPNTKINSENDSSKECSNDEQGRYTISVEKTMTVDMVIGDKPIMEQSRSAELFELKRKLAK